MNGWIHVCNDTHFVTFLVGDIVSNLNKRTLLLGDTHFVTFLVGDVVSNLKKRTLL